jgi:xanthine dehydrogenase accessory factor
VKEIYDILCEFEKRRGQSFALATLVRAEGSSYRRPGARMLVCEDGHTVGSLSGGCVEAEVSVRARDVLRSGAAAVMDFDMRRRFGCNGKIDIFIERVSENFLVDLARNLAAQCSCRVITTSVGSSIIRDDVVVPWEANGFPYSPFVQEIHPPIRLLVFGGGPDTAPLCQLCELLGWQAIEIVDANAFSIEPDEWTAAIVKSHHYGRDFTALQKLLPLDLRYVGLISPRKRRDQLLNDLLDVSVAINAGFFAPAGLDIGMETPQEIALSIVAEIQRVFAGGSGESLRERKISIHVSKKSIVPNEWQTSAR